MALAVSVFIAHLRLIETAHSETRLADTNRVSVTNVPRFKGAIGMFQSIVQELCQQWFEEHARLAYWVSRRWCQRFAHYRAMAYSASDLEELAQDAVCRGYDRFVKRSLREVCGASDRKRWICQCV